MWNHVESEIGITDRLEEILVLVMHMDMLNYK